MIEDPFLWCERYRPKTVQGCILPDHLKTPFQAYVDAKKIPNLILTGTPGVGKTTIARAMCDEIDCDYIIINGSTESGIDTLRIKIMGFASSVSLMGGRKVIIVDEADNLSAAAQLGFRGVIEEVANNCSFIFTCNHLNRLHEAIHSRCAVIHFKLTGDDKTKMATLFLSRVRDILENEEIAYQPKVLVELILKHFPDYRRILNELQYYASSGTIDVGILSQFSDVKIDELIKHLKTKDFRSIRTWVGNNSDTDSHTLMRAIYDRMYDIVVPNSLPVLVILLGKYQDMAANVADQEINTMAFLVELMIEAEFR